MTLPDQPTAEIAPHDRTPPGVRRTIFISTMIIGGLLSLILIPGIILAFTPDFAITSARLAYLRNLLLTLLTIQVVLVVVAMSILVTQLARLVNLLTNGTRIVLHNANETVGTARSTIGFISEQTVGPVVKMSGFLAGLGVLIREIAGLRRAVRRAEEKPLDEQPTQ